MTATERKWAERVRAWRDSGVSAREFSLAQEFSASGLYQWAHRLKESRNAATTTMSRHRVRIARVEWVASAPPAALVVEVGAARLRVPSGFDAATLRAAIGALLDGARR